MLSIISFEISEYIKYVEGIKNSVVVKVVNILLVGIGVSLVVVDGFVVDIIGSVVMPIVRLMKLIIIAVVQII